MIADEIIPYSFGPSKLVCPKQSLHDEFLDSMSKILRWSRFLGVAGSGNILWKIWGVFMFLLLFSVQCGAIYKLIKLLLGLTAFSAGNRSVTARLAGTIFYTLSTVALILCWRFSSKWRKLAAQWSSAEIRSAAVFKDGTLKKRMMFVTIFMAVGSFVEHAIAVIASVGFDCPLDLILEKYILDSHAFILIQSDYSLAIAVPLVFMSNIATVLWNFQDLLIILMSMGLSSRYYRLNQCVANARKQSRKEKWAINSEVMRIYKWRKIRDAYVKQAKLVRCTDGVIGGLIVMSSLGNFYFICLQLFLGFTQGISDVFIKKVYSIVSLIWIVVRFSCVVMSAADINVRSRSALIHLHSCNTRTYNVEVERLQKQLSKDFVALSGMGFFYLERTLLLQAGGAVVTYALVLVQFDNKGFQDDVYSNITNSK